MSTSAQLAQGGGTTAHWTSFVAPYGKVFVNFTASTLIRAVELKPNKIPGCLGDVYLVAHFEPSEVGLKYDRNVSCEDFDRTEKLPEYLKWHWEETHGIMPSCSNPDVWRSIVYELRFKSLFYYNEYKEASTEIANSALNMVLQEAPHFYRDCQIAFLRYNKAFKHPESEFVHTSGTIRHPKGMDVQLLRSFAALEAYCDGIVYIANTFIKEAEGTCFGANVLKHTFDGFEIDCPGVHSDEYANNISKVWEGLYKRTLAQAAESAAARAHRLAMHDAMMEAEQAEAKAKEQRRKLQAAESRAAKANAPEAPYTAWRRLSAAAKAARQRRQSDREAETAAALAHEVHVLPKGLPPPAAELRKAVAHADKVICTLLKYDRMRELLELSAAHEAASRARGVDDQPARAAVDAVELK